LGELRVEGKVEDQMRIIIELEAGTKVTGITSQSAAQSDSSGSAAINAGPPAVGARQGGTTGDAVSYNQDIGGPPAELFAKVEAARAAGRAH
jgi:hypothetical protein